MKRRFFNSTVTYRTVAACAVILGAALPITGRADCSYPQAPASIPDGNSASKDEMMNAMQAFKKYNDDTNGYLACLDRDMETQRQDTSLTPEMIVQIKSINARKHNTAVTELQAKADEFNKQVRIYKARSG